MKILNLFVIYIFLIQQCYSFEIGRLTKIIDPSGNIAQKSYDLNRNISARCLAILTLKVLY